MNNSSDWTEVIGAVGLFALLITIIAVVATQLGAWMRARAKTTRESEYRQLAERTVAGQDEISRQVTQISEQLADMRTRLEWIETVLKQVE
jgi:hypothetical protein